MYIILVKVELLATFGNGAVMLKSSTLVKENKDSSPQRAKFTNYYSYL